MINLFNCIKQNYIILKWPFPLEQKCFLDYFKYEYLTVKETFEYKLDSIRKESQKFVRKF